MECAAIAFSAARGLAALSPPCPQGEREGDGACPRPVHTSATVTAKLAAMRRLASAAALLAFLTAPAAAQSHYGLSQSENDRFLAELAAKPGIQKLPNGVLYRVLASGAGAAPASRADKVAVSYTGVLINGSRFGASDPAKPSVFTISRTIPGWGIALMQMKEGDRWEVIVPADQAYGGGSAGAVPPDQTLVFTLTLVHVEHAS